MAHEIFLSYSSRHRALTEALVALIEARYGAGAVWWDHALEARGPYAPQIDAALQAARVVVVLWTAGAVASEYVRAEASTAHATGKLVNVRASDLRARHLPAPFNIHHVVDVADTERLLRDIANAMAGRPVATVAPLHEQYFRAFGQRLVDARQTALPADVLDISPSALLLARHEQVAYLDATGQRAAWLDWALQHPRPAAGRLLHGPGGVGKTRLLIDLAAELRQRHGWMAGFVDPVPHGASEAQRLQHAQALQQCVEQGEEPGLLLVLDYAEGRQAEVVALAQWIEARPEPARRPVRLVRLVLLARGAGEWWQRLAEEHGELQRLWRAPADAPAVQALPAFEAPDQRLQLLHASCAAYRPVLAAQGLALPAGEPPAALRQRIEAGDRRSRPLSIQMEALVWLAGGATAAEAPGIAELLNQVLGLERRHWARVWGALDEAAITELERGLAQITLVQGVPDRPAAEALLARDAHYQGLRLAPAQLAPLLGRLARLHGGADGEALRALEPDLLGEHLVARVADDRLLDACIAWVDALADVDAPDAAARRPGLVSVLQRATAPEHGTRASARARRGLERLVARHLERWAPAVVAVIVETPGALRDCLEAQVDRVDVPALQALYGALPLRTLALDVVALRVAQRLADAARGALAAAGGGDLDSHAQLAGRCVNLGVRLAAMGQREAALATAEESVQIFRWLADRQPNVFEPYLAKSLNNLGLWLSDVGRREAALAAAEEALKIRRRLAQSRPDAFEPGLAGSLSNLGLRLADLGRHEAALAAAEEAVQIWRRRAQSRPDAFEPDLAGSLNNLGKGLLNLGRLEAALAVAEEALQIRRRLAQARPDAFEPDLATSLNNLGNCLSKLGRHEEALAVAEEAMQIYRRLAQFRSHAFEPAVAGSLNNLSNRLAELDRGEAALAAVEEAVQIYRRLAQSRTDAFEPDLARSLYNLGNRLSDLGRGEAALAAIEEAIEIRHRLAQSWPDAFSPDLASSLGAFAQILADSGQPAEAARRAAEGLSVLLPLLQRLPQALGGLAKALAQDHLRHAQAAAQQPDAALLAEVDPLLHSPPEGNDEAPPAT